MSDCFILQFRGLSWVSRLIQIQTRSRYSHTAIMTPDNTVIEAWHRGPGVQEVDSIRVLHTSGTPCDLFEIQGDYDQDVLCSFLREQLGAKYDWLGVARFLTRRYANVGDRWFCSELVGAGMERAGLPLSNLEPHLLSPRDIAASVRLKKVSTIYA